jgi:sugar lactone lactonase YvrE
MLMRFTVKRFLLSVLLIVSSLMVVVAQDSAPVELPDEVIFSSDNAMPEGIEWDAASARFLVGSLMAGTISAIDDAGEVTELIVDEDLVSTVGIHIADGILYVTNSSSAVFFNPNAPALVSVAAYDLASGERIYWSDATDLREGRGFANDLTVDADGNVYVTNSFQPVVYQITPEGEASILIESDAFAGNFLGLNGIEYHPDSYLLVAMSESGSIFKVPLDDPEVLTAVELPEPISIDGMALGRDGVLYAVARLGEPETQQIIALTSEDDWESAEVTASVEASGVATTLALRYASEDETVPTVYYINAYLQNPARGSYEIVRAAFEPMQ